MRKITAKRQDARKQKRNQMIGSIVLVAILLLSILGYSFGNENSSAEEVYYKGYKFTEDNGFWVLEKDGFTFSFRYNPNELEEVDSELNALESYSAKPLYISSEDIESESEIYRNLFYYNEVVSRMQLACLEGEICDDSELPVKTCEDNFIIVKESEKTEVTQENNCVFIKGKSEDLTKITDAVLLKIIGL